MSTGHPPKVELTHRRLGPIEVLKRGSRNVISIIPAQLLKAHFASGRALWKWYSIAGPDEARHVLVENVQNYPRSPLVHRVLSPAFRTALILEDGPERDWFKGLLAPHFQKSAARKHTALFRECAEDQAEKLPKSGALEFDAQEFMANLTLSAIFRVMTSKDSVATFNKDGVRDAFFGYLDQVARVSILDLLRLPTSIVMALRPGRMRKMQMVRAEIDGIVAERKAEGARGRTDLLQALIDAHHPVIGGPMPDEQIRDAILLHLFSGHETMSSTLAWAVFLLADRPDLQEALRTELGATSAQELRAIPEATPLLDAVLNETMRLYPGGPLMVRHVRDADEIAGCPVKRGAFMFVPIYALHRNENLWDDPDAFRPERFLPGQSNRRSPFQFLPFSAGPNSCIGANFAVVEMRTILADFVLRFQFQRSQNHPAPRPEAVLTMKAEGGVWIEAHRR